MLVPCHPPPGRSERAVWRAVINRSIQANCSAENGGASAVRVPGHSPEEPESDAIPVIEKISSSAHWKMPVTCPAS